MIISHKYKFLFFCPVGNCATTSVYKALLPLHDEKRVERIYEFNFEHPLNKNPKEILDPQEGIHKDKLIVSKHIPPRRFFELNFFKEKEFENYIKFSIVRNPWDWCLAVFLKASRFPCSQKGFFFNEDHFYNVLSKITTSKNFHKTQYDTLSNANGECYITNFLKFENLSNDLTKICGKLAVPPIELGHEQNNNNETQKKYQNYYTEKSRQLVGEYFKKDIEKFNYDF